MKLKGLTVGIGITGSFCTYEKLYKSIEKIREQGAEIITILSNAAETTDTRFGTASDFIKKITQLTGRAPVTKITEVEPLGPKNAIDVLLIAPCTGNTAAKLANAITDGPVLMAAKSHLRNNKPLVISLSTNDALGLNLKNIGLLLNSKNIFFVPFGQDNFKSKPNSLISNNDLIIPTLESALDGQQYQPVITGAK